MTFRMGKRAAMEMHLGNKEVYQVRQGEALVYAKQLTVSQTLDGVTSDAPSSVAWGDGLVVTLTATAGNKVQENSVVVTMGETDITSTAYNHSTKTITIASVTGNVSITAVGMPYDAEVEYLQSDGYEYIDTGLTLASGTTKVELVFEAAFTALTYSGNSLYVICSIPNAGVQIYTSSGIIANQGASKTILTNTYYQIDCVTTATSRSVKIDGGSAGTQSFSRSITDDNPLYIIGQPLQASSRRCSQAKHKSYKIYINDVLVRDFVAVRDNGVGYLYDKISGQLFGNAASSGAFTYGNDK